MKTVIENGEQFELNPKQFSDLKPLLYYCDECKVYHVKEEGVREFKQLVSLLEI